jgi:hypothetical protein
VPPMVAFSVRQVPEAVACGRGGQGSVALQAEVSPDSKPSANTVPV